MADPSATSVGAEEEEHPTVVEAPPLDPGRSSASSPDWLRAQLGAHDSADFLRARNPPPAVLSAAVLARTELLFHLWNVMFGQDASGRVGGPWANLFGTESAQELVRATRRGVFYDPATLDLFCVPAVDGRDALQPLALTLSLENGIVDLARVFSDGKEALIELKDSLTISVTAAAAGGDERDVTALFSGINARQSLFRRHDALAALGVLASAVTVLTLRHPDAVVVYAVGTDHLVQVLRRVDQPSAYVTGKFRAGEGGEGAGYQGLALPATARQIQAALAEENIDALFDGPFIVVEPRSQRPGDILAARLEALLRLHELMLVGRAGGPPLARAGTAARARTPREPDTTPAQHRAFLVGDAFESMCRLSLAHALGGAAAPAALAAAGPAADWAGDARLLRLVKEATLSQAAAGQIVAWRNTKELEQIDVMVGASWLEEFFERLSKPDMDAVYGALCLLWRLPLIAARLCALHRAAEGARWCDGPGAAQVPLDHRSLAALREAVQQLFALLTVPGDARELRRAQLEDVDAPHYEQRLRGAGTATRTAAAWARALVELSLRRLASACSAAAREALARDLGSNAWPFDAPEAATRAAFEQLGTVGRAELRSLDEPAGAGLAAALCALSVVAQRVWDAGQQLSHFGADGWQVKGAAEDLFLRSGKRGAYLPLRNNYQRWYCGIAGFFLGVVADGKVESLLDGVLGAAEHGVLRVLDTGDPIAVVREALGAADLSLVLLPATVAASLGALHISALPASLALGNKTTKAWVPVADPVDSTAPPGLDLGSEALARLSHVTRLFAGVPASGTLDGTADAWWACEEVFRGRGWPLRPRAPVSVPRPQPSPFDEIVGTALQENSSFQLATWTRDMRGVGP